jgi:hypothetical protein
MRVKVRSASGDLTNYIKILEKYNLEKINENKCDNQYSYIELNNIEEIKDISIKIIQYFKSLGLTIKDNFNEDALVFLYHKNEDQLVLEIYDGYRE